MFKPLPPTGARMFNSRTAFYFGYPRDSPGMIRRIPDVGSRYLIQPEGVQRGNWIQTDPKDSL